MGWIKRNLFFVIGGIVALLLLGAAGFYVFREWQRSTEAFTHLNKVYDSLKNNTITDPKTGQRISPGNDKVDNIAAARDQERQLHQWIARSTNYFQPIPPIPNPANGRIEGQDSLFANALHATFDQLRAQATNANVTLPTDFCFSFTAEEPRVTFARGSLGPLAAQLGEVKAITDVLYAAGINALDGIQRLPVSPDDAGSAAPTDYFNGQSTTNDLGVLTPYQATFRGFSPEIARVLEGFANSSHGFIVQDISVQPANAGATAAGAYSTNPNNYLGQAYPGQISAQQQAARAAYLAAARAATGNPVLATPQPVRGGLQTILNEQELSVTLKVEVVKMTPHN